MSTPASGSRGRPRLEQTNQRILHAAVQLLREGGPAAVNIDSVAARSGVARTTIYRRHRSRTELMTAVLDQLIEAPLPAPELSIADKLRWVLERVSGVLDHGLGPGGVAAVLADSDPEFTLALRTRIADQLVPMTDMMAADITTGQLAAHVDPDIGRAPVRRPPGRGAALRHAAPRLDGPQRRPPHRRHHTRLTGVVRSVRCPQWRSRISPAAAPFHSKGQAFMRATRRLRAHGT